MTLLKSLLISFTIAVAGIAQAASNVYLVGVPEWRLQGKECTFLLRKYIGVANWGPTTAKLRLSLWVSEKPYPAAGHRVATHELGVFDYSHQITDLEVSTKLDMPKLTGKHFFTVVVEEETQAGWVTATAGPSVEWRLKKGVLANPKWEVPIAPVTAPVDELTYGDMINLTFRGYLAEDGIYTLPKDAQKKMYIAIYGKRTTEEHKRAGDSTIQGIHTYRIRNGNLAGGSHKVGFLTLDLNGCLCEYSLFFQSPSHGFFKQVERTPSYKTTMWGTFTLSQ